MAFLADIASWVLLVLGGFLVITGTVGVLRFPDFFTRMHAAGVTDTSGSGLILLGLILQSDFQWLVISKLLFIMLFIFFTSPTSSHALAKAALHSGLKPWVRPTSPARDAGNNASKEG